MNESTKTAFIDVLFSTLIGTFCLFVVAFISMNPKATESKAIEQKAEFVIEMSWPDGSLDDVDLWLLTPTGNKVGFNSQDMGLATLDRDDRGAYGDVYLEGTVPKLIRLNKEVIAIRAILPGRYVVNAHLYNDFTTTQLGFPEVAPDPLPVTAKLTKLNPKVAEVVSSVVTLERVDQQRTFFSFEIDAAGNVSNVQTAADLPFIALKSGSSPP